MSFLDKSINEKLKIVQISLENKLISHEEKNNDKKQMK